MGFRNIEYFDYYEHLAPMTYCPSESANMSNDATPQISVNEYLANEVPRY